MVWPARTTRDISSKASGSCPRSFSSRASRTPLDIEQRQQRLRSARRTAPASGFWLSNPRAHPQGQPHGRGLCQQPPGREVQARLLDHRLEPKPEAGVAVVVRRHLDRELTGVLEQRQLPRPVALPLEELGIAIRFFFFSPALVPLALLARHGRHLDEYKEVLKRLRVRSGLIGRVVNLIRERAEEVKVRPSIEIQPDPKDDPFCLCAEQAEPILS